MDHIVTLSAAIQKHTSKKGGKLYVAFIDLAFAFDSVNRNLLMKVLEESGVSGKVMGILKTMYSEVFACVKTDYGCSEMFECKKGLRQGCNLSPTIFAAFINQIALELRKSGRHGVHFFYSGG